jgi:hypothetical protein
MLKFVHSQGEGVMEYLIIWAAIAAFTGYLAGKKGRSVGAWVILGALFSFLALFAIWLVNPIGIDQEKSLEIAKKFGVSSLYRKCPECAEIVSREACKCKHCQSALEPIAA